MKHIVNIFVIFFIIFSSSLTALETKVVYIDINIIMNKSNVGIELKKQLEEMSKESIDNFKKIENELKEEEKKILSQKNILEKSEYDDRISKLRERANKYRKDREEKINSLTTKRIQSNKTLLDLVKPILTEYSKKNSISLLLQKKNIIMGAAELDITSDILKLVNEKAFTIEVK